MAMTEYPPLGRTPELLAGDPATCQMPNAPPALSVSPCLDGAALLTAYRLRHASYLSKGFITESTSGCFVDTFDALPNSVTFGAWRGDTMVGSIRACVLDARLGWEHAPAVEAYGDALGRWRAGRTTIIEWNRFVIAPQAGVSATAVEVALLSAVPFLATRFEAPAFVAGIRVRHAGFYRRFGYEPISDPVQYPGTTFHAVLHAMDWAPHAERLRHDRFFGRAFMYSPRLEALPPRERAAFEARFPMPSASQPVRR